MNLRRTAAALSAAAFASTMLVGAAAPATIAQGSSPGVDACDDHAGESSGARVKHGAKKAVEPALYKAKDAKKYGVIKDAPYLGDGAVTIETVFHVITEQKLSPAAKAEYVARIDDQVQVLNDAYSGATGGADSPFRFELTDTTWTANPTWAHLTPGKGEVAPKKALHVGGSETLNVYTADIGGGLLGWAYFPKDYNNGHDWRDGVVILDESMPGGSLNYPREGSDVVDSYSQGDTLTHEVGHWLMLEHTFAGGCSASGDGVADTPREAFPQFECDQPDEAYDSCRQPGLDPIHNFMDYTYDNCMYEFTRGQAERMSDAWVAFRAGGNG
ncbi:zinc metalloprotease [Nocardioides aestuarii]|uniref:Zinc metalloprotease n=1 Tax=Nocardioides aestuarii TaxID=252231 RepID=A0ABW4TNS9_9ACTN